MLFRLTTDRATRPAALRYALVCCAAAALWLAASAEASAGVMMSSQPISGEVDSAGMNGAETDWGNESQAADLPWTQSDGLPLDTLGVPSVPSLPGGAGGGTSGSVSGGPTCGLPWVVCDVHVPQLVTCLAGEGTRFVPPASASDLLDPPRAELARRGMPNCLAFMFFGTVPIPAHSAGEVSI
jgi:hypothetical protein